MSPKVRLIQAPQEVEVNECSQTEREFPPITLTSSIKIKRFYFCFQSLPNMSGVEKEKG